MGLEACQGSRRPCHHFWKVPSPTKVAVLIAGSRNIFQVTVDHTTKFAGPYCGHYV